MTMRDVLKSLFRWIKPKYTTELTDRIQVISLAEVAGEWRVTFALDGKRFSTQAFAGMVGDDPWPCRAMQKLCCAEEVAIAAGDLGADPTAAWDGERFGECPPRVIIAPLSLAPPRTQKMEVNDDNA